MNANELADKLDEYNKDGMPVLVVGQAVDMLRQQQVEINSLRKSLDVALIIINELEEGFNSSLALNKAQAERNDKPVAWITTYDLERLPRYDCWVNGEKSRDSVPLYIHQIKKLTDEDLKQLVIDMPTEPSENELYEFAYDVLRKAQEK